MNSSVPRMMPVPESGSTTRRGIRACVSCATAKAKCVPRVDDENGECERCHRLNKRCASQAPSAPRKKRVQKATRVDQLEQKLDGIVNLLTASKSQSASASPSATVDDPTTGFLHTQTSHTPLATHRPSFSNPFDEIDESNLAPSSDGSSGYEGTSDAGQSSGKYHFSEAMGSTLFFHPLEEAEALLTLFRAEMAEYFPFVVLPPGTTAGSLRQKKPLVYMTIILAASYRNPTFQMRFGEEIMEYITSQLFFKGEKTFDMLQGLLLYIAWYPFHHSSKNPQLTNLLQWAVALVIDLGLNKGRRAKDRHTMMIAATEFIHAAQSNSEIQNSDERRALAGCFYLTSIVSVCFKKMDAMRFTPHLEDSCRLLAEAAEYPSDIYLVHLVHLQRTAQQIGNSLPYDETGSDWTSTMPIGIYTKSLEKKLQTLRNDIPRELPTHHYTTLLMQLNSVEIYLYEISLHEVTRYPCSNDNPELVLWRLETLYACLLSTKGFFDGFFSESTRRFLGFPLAVWTQLTHALIILSKLCLYDCENWDLNQVRGVLDFTGVLDQVMGQLELTKDVLRLDGEDVFSRFICMLRGVKDWYNKKWLARMNRDVASHEFTGLFRNEFVDEGFWSSMARYR